MRNARLVNAAVDYCRRITVMLMFRNIKILLYNYILDVNNKSQTNVAREIPFCVTKNILCCVF